MSTPIYSSSADYSSQSLAPPELPKRNRDDVITVVSSEPLAKKQRTPSSSLSQRATVHTPSYFIYRFEECMLNCIESSNPSTVEINEEGYQILEEAFSQFCGEPVLHRLLETFTNGNSFFGRNFRIAKELFTFGTKHRVRFHLPTVNLLRAYGFGFSESPQLQITTDLSGSLVGGTQVSSTSSIKCKLLTETAFSTLNHTLSIDKSITGLRIKATRERYHGEKICKDPKKETYILTSKYIPPLLNTLTECSQLKSLTIEFGMLNRIKAGRAIAAHINSSPHLSYLHIEHSQFSIEGATAILHAMGTNTSITGLNLTFFEDVEEAGDEVIADFEQALTTMMQNNTTLKSLHMEDPACPNIGTVISRTLKDNSSLTSLTLPDLTLIENVDILNALRTHSTLQKLTLTPAESSDRMISNLAQLLQYNTTLTDLSLTRSLNLFQVTPDISDDHGLAIANALRNQSTLKRLNLHNYDISDLTARHILEALKNNSSLETFHFFQRKPHAYITLVTDRAIQLIESNPHITDIRYRTFPLDVHGGYQTNSHIQEYSSRSKENAFLRNATLFNLLFAQTMLEIV